MFVRNMACSIPGVFIKHFGVIDSTNSYARASANSLWAEAGEASVVVVRADEQTAGRGQRGNVWLSSAGDNLLVSIMVRPTALKVVSQFALSQVVALAVRSAMAFYDIDVVLKWPNDIYVGGCKLAGILVELDCCGDSVEQAVMGVGLNVNQSAFAPMDRVPVSMKMLRGTSFAVDEVLATLLDSFSRYYAMLLAWEYEALATEYKKHLLGYGRVMHYRDEKSSFEAEIVGVGCDGRISLRRADGSTSKYAFKEVELLL